MQLTVQSIGKTFQGLSNVILEGAAVTFEARVLDLASTMPGSYETDYLIHPATLDAVFQSSLVAIPTMTNVGNQAWIPTVIDSVQISSDMVCVPGMTFRGFCESEFGISREVKGCIMASDSDFNTLPGIIVEGVTLTGLGRNQEQVSMVSHSESARLYALPVWMPDLDLIAAVELRKAADEKYGRQLHMRDFCSESVQLINELCQDAVRRISPKIDYKSLPHHLRKYFDWMQSRCKLTLQNGTKMPGNTNTNESSNPKTGTNGIRKDENDAVKHKLDAFRAKYPVDGTLVETVFSSLVGIFAQQVVPIALLMKKDKLSKFYCDSYGLQLNMQIFRDWFNLKAHKSPGMRVVEIGAGTAATTLPVLQQLGSDKTQTPRFFQWTFTDISPAWFEHAKCVLDDWNERIEYKVLDIDKSPIDQGFAAESYDVVLAVNVSILILPNLLLVQYGSTIL